VQLIYIQDNLVYLKRMGPIRHHIKRVQYFYVSQSFGVYLIAWVIYKSTSKRSTKI